MQKLRIAALVGLALACAAPAGALAQTRTLSIATAGTAGVYYALGGAIAQLLTERIDNLEVTAEVTGGSVDNARLVGTDPGYIGLASADAVADAVKGEGKFDAPLPVRTLAALYPNHVQIVATKASGIASVADMKGRRISTGAPGSGFEVVALRLLRAAGLHPDKDLTRERLAVGDSISALKDGKIDAAFLVGGAPFSAITDLLTSPGIDVTLVSHGDLLTELQKEYGGTYSRGVIPAATYPGIDGEVTGIDTWNLLIANDGLDPDLAHAIVKALFDGRQTLSSVQKDAADIDLANQTTETTPAPIHPGAERFYKEARGRQ